MIFTEKQATAFYGSDWQSFIDENGGVVTFDGFECFAEVIDEGIGQPFLKLTSVDRVDFKKIYGLE